MWSSSVHRLSVLRGVALAFLGALTMGSAARAADHFVQVPLQESSFLGYVEDEFIVIFKADARGTLVVRDDTPGRPVVNLPTVQAALDAHGAIAMRRQFPGGRARGRGTLPDLTGHYKVKLSPGQDLDAAVAAFAADRDVDHVEKIGMHTIDATPNDTYYDDAGIPPSFPYPQWHYWDTFGIDANLAWDTEAGDPSVAVGILDTGIKYRHNDLGGNNPAGPADNVTAGNVWVNPGEIPGNLLDDDLNGYVDDVIGWDFVATVVPPAGYTCIDVDCGLAENDPNDGNGHGTHVAGTVAAITNNARAVAGVAGGYSDGTTGGAGNGCKVIPLRIGYTADPPGPGTVGIVQMDAAAEAMYYVAGKVDDGVNVAAINCSWGSSNTGGLDAAVDFLLGRDVMIFKSAGNLNVSTSDFLGGKAGVIAVAATDRNGAKASYSNYGSWVEIAAPGGDADPITSTWHERTAPDTTLMYVAGLVGTSMAAPHCAGVAALIESQRPWVDRLGKWTIMSTTATAYTPGFDLGDGIVNANNALASVVGVGDPLIGRPRLSLRASPNPTRSGSDFVIGSPAGTTVRLAIVDVNGRQVREFAGSGRLRWDGNDAHGQRVPAGLYLAIARSGGASVTTKLTVLP